MYSAEIKDDLSGEVSSNEKKKVGMKVQFKGLSRARRYYNEEVDLIRSTSENTLGLDRALESLNECVDQISSKESSQDDLYSTSYSAESDSESSNDSREDGSESSANGKIEEIEENSTESSGEEIESESRDIREIESREIESKDRNFGIDIGEIESESRDSTSNESEEETLIQRMENIKGLAGKKSYGGSNPSLTHSSDHDFDSSDSEPLSVMYAKAKEKERSLMHSEKPIVAQLRNSIDDENSPLDKIMERDGIKPKHLNDTRTPMRSPQESSVLEVISIESLKYVKTNSKRRTWVRETREAVQTSKFAPGKLSPSRIPIKRVPGEASVRIYIFGADNYKDIVITREDKTRNIIDSVLKDTPQDVSECALFEIRKKIGLERPFFDWEIPLEVIMEWNLKTEDNTLIIKPFAYVHSLSAKRAVEKFVIKKGYVHKEVDPGKWRKGYGVLRKGILYCFKDKSCSELLSKNDLINRHIFTPVVKRGKNVCKFSLLSKTENKSFWREFEHTQSFYLKDEDEYNIWLTALRISKSKRTLMENTKWIGKRLGQNM